MGNSDAMQKNMSVSQACKIVGMNRSNWYRPIQNQKEKNQTVIDVLNEVVNFELSTSLTCYQSTKRLFYHDQIPPSNRSVPRCM